LETELLQIDLLQCPSSAFSIGLKLVLVEIIVSVLIVVVLLGGGDVATRTVALGMGLLLIDAYLEEL
jgi:hypothetical protein